jgi:hypothetical protein
MNNIGNTIREGLMKRVEAMAKHNARKEEFVKTRARVIQDIEEARNIWKTTLKQLPKQEF